MSAPEIESLTFADRNRIAQHAAQHKWTCNADTASLMADNNVLRAALATERAMHELLSRASTEIIQESNRLKKENAALREECESIRGWHKVVRHL